MNIHLYICICTILLLSACGGSDGAGQDNSDADTSWGPLTISGLPDPCNWLSVAEAREVLRMDSPPKQTSMGDEQTSGRSCIYTDADQSQWINVGYEGLNPQVFSAEGKSAEELVELAAGMYAYGLTHVESTETDGHPTLAFEDANRTIMIVFSGVGKARDMPEGMRAGHSISSYINPTLLLMDPGTSREQRLEALKGLVERPVAQLVEAAGK